MWREASRASVIHMCGYSYRFVPVSQLGRGMIEAGGPGPPGATGDAEAGGSI